MNAAALADPLRRAALELHALPASDRSWILAALPADERSELEALLSELRELGIPPEAGLLAAPAAQRDTDFGLGVMDAPRVAALARVLAAEPAGLTRALLSVRHWGWRPALLRELDAHRRVEVASLTTPAPAQPTPRLQTALLEALARRLDAAGAESSPSGWGRLRARLAQLRSAP
jgi:hypothetical protein